jgi:hypothetical protein
MLSILHHVVKITIPTANMKSQQTKTSAHGWALKIAKLGGAEGI